MPEANDTFPTALLKWETAGANLTTALSGYLESCAFLSTCYLSQDARTVASRVDICLDTLHSKFSEELSRSRLLLAQMRNKILAPSFSLPREILAEIFKDVVYIPGLNETPFPSMTEGLKRIFGRLHTLLAVCSTWRNTAIELSELWSVLPVAHEDSYRPTPNTASLMLRRSRALVSNRRNLHLAAVLLDRHCGEIAPFFDENIPQFTSINIEAGFQSPVNIISNFLSHISTSKSASVLSELSMHHYEDPMVVSNRPPRLPQINEYVDIHPVKLIQSLSIFRLRSINVRWNTLKLSEKLVEIHLQSVVLGDQPKLIEFLHVLESAPELRDLKLISVGAFVDGDRYFDFDITSAQITLPRLQSLLLDDLPFNVLETVLISILPGSHKIKLRLTPKSSYTQGEDINSSWGDYQRLESLLKRSHIDTLFFSPDDEEYQDIKSPWVNPEILRRKLQSFPDLKTLIMYSWKWNEEALLALDYKNGGIPQLTGIYIFGGYIHDADVLPRVAASHPLQTLVLDSDRGSTFGCDRDLLVRSLRTIVPDFRLVREIDEFNYYSWRLW